ncbi:MAG TPA: rod shape-determining protein MreD [Symbiobacteriaceae bacterium]
MRYWGLTAIVVVSYLLQSVVAAHLSIGQVAPDFILVVVVCYGLLFGWEVGLGAGVVGGLLVDLTTGRFIGLHVLSLGLVGLAVGQLEDKVFKDNYLMAPVAGFAGSILNQAVQLICQLLYGWEVPARVLRSTVLPAAVYAMVLTLIVYRQLYRYYLYLKPDPRGTIELRRR